MNEEKLLCFADTFAFIGNSLLTPMSRTERIGLEPEFWRAFPDFDDDHVAEAVGSCNEFADGASVAASMGRDMVEEVSVEFTKLFIGPPAPAAPPWETMNREEGVSVGFGQPTFDMQAILRDMGLEVSNENNQYADHIGLELLTLSEMCRRAAAGSGEGSDVDDATIGDIRTFVADHPLGWISTLHDNVRDEYDNGYYVGLLALAKALMEAFVESD